MKLLHDLLATLEEGTLQDLRVGAFWSAVVVETKGQRRCGLAATLREEGLVHGSDPEVRQAGRLIGGSALELAGMVRSERLMERAIGMAAVNALLPRLETRWTEGNAEEILARRGAGKRVAMVGHFPFANRLRQRVGALWVLEQHPCGDDLPAEAAPDVIPQADVVVITATTLMNGTFAGLMALRRADAWLMLLGPSTPLSPVLFDYGVDMLSGAVVTDVDAALAAVSQGAGFRQVHWAGVRLVTMEKPGAVETTVIGETPSLGRGAWIRNSGTMHIKRIQSRRLCRTGFWRRRWKGWRRGGHWIWAAGPGRTR